MVCCRLPSLVNIGAIELIESENTFAKVIGELQKFPGSAGGQLPGRIAFTGCLENWGTLTIFFRLIPEKLASSTFVFREQADRQLYRNRLSKREDGFMEVEIVVRTIYSGKKEIIRIHKQMYLVKL